MTEVAFMVAGKWIDPDGVSRLLKAMSDKVQIDLSPLAIGHLWEDWGRIEVSVNGKKRKLLFDLEGPDDEQKLFLVAMKPPHCFPYSIPFGDCDDGILMLDAKVASAALREIRYVILEWLRAASDVESVDAADKPADYLGITLDPDLRQVTREGSTTGLSPVEFKMFVVAWKCGECGLSIDEFLNKVYPDKKETPSSSVIGTNADRMNAKLSRLGVRFDAATRTPAAAPSKSPSRELSSAMILAERRVCLLTQLT